MLSQNDSGSDSATTRSAISVTDAAHQTQDVASLSRDTTNTNGTVAKLPDVNNLLDRQADTMAAASAAGEAVSRRVGDFAQSKYDEAKANGDQAGMDAWKEGGIARAEMQAAGAAIVTGLAGANAVGGAAGAAIASIAAGKLNELSGAIAGANPTGSGDVNTVLGNIVANAIATGAGGAIGGNAGAVSGYDVDRFNRQLHPDEYALAKKDAKIVAKQLGISEQEAEGRIVAEMLRNSDQQTSDAAGGVHDYQVRAIIGCQNLNCDGYKNDPQYANHSYNSQYIASNQQAYDAGQGQLNKGVTYNDLVKNNVKNNPVSTAIAGAAMIATGGLVAGGVPAIGGMIAGGGIGATVNSAAQYGFNNGQISPVDVGMAAVTGALTFGTDFLPGLLINTGGAPAGSAIKGDNPNLSMAGAAAGTAVGYKAGGWTESSMNSILNPWYRAEWVDIGMGVSKYVPPNVLPSLGGTVIGAMGSEGTSGTMGIIVNPPVKAPKK
nr:hemolysin [Paraburkholderia sp. Ac-20340]